MRFFNQHKQELSDEELLARYKDTGDSTCFDQLYQRYIPLVYGLCLKYLQNTSHAQDAVVDIYESLVGKITGYEIAVFKNWLYSVVKNHCFRILRDNKKEVIVNFDSQIMESDAVTHLFDEDEDEEKEAALKQCIEKLPEPQKVSVLLFFYEDKSYADIVDQTGYNMKSVKSYIQNGKRNLKICIDKALGR